MTQRNEAALNTVVETHLLPNGYIALDRDGFDRQRVNFPETVLACICATQPKEWVNQDTQHTAADHPILMLKEGRTALMAAAVTGGNTIHESTEDALPGQ